MGSGPLDGCAAAGCVRPATQTVPYLARPSLIPRQHPDYRPPATTLRACDEHAEELLEQSEARETLLLLSDLAGPPREWLDSDTKA